MTIPDGSKKVDPFVIPLPQKLAGDPELAPFFRYLSKWNHDMWQRTGAGNDDISDHEDRIDSLETRMTAVEARVTQNEADIAQNVVDIEFNRHYAYMGA